MNQSARRWLLGFLFAVLTIILLSSYYIYSLLITPYRTYTEPRLVVEIPRGTSLDSVARLLYAKGIVKHPLLLKLVFKWKRGEGQIKAGDYVFDRALTPMQLYDKLLKGEMTYTVLTIPEGSNVFDVERILKERKIAGAEDFRAAMGSADVISELHAIDPSLTSLEGFLFPETYFLSKKDDTSKVLITMIREFKNRYSPAYQKRATEIGMTVLQVVTLASLVEKETGKKEERALISGVFHNRLQKSMLLQCDPTVIYSLLLVGNYKGYISRQDLKFDSPYNTYVYPGLPPGPISNPGEDSIRAALYPENTDKLYFVSRNDGSHYFSSTLAEHNRAVQQYQR